MRQGTRSTFTMVSSSLSSPPIPRADSRVRSQTAIFNFESLLLVILLVICTCTYARATAPGLVDRNREGSVTTLSLVLVRGPCADRLLVLESSMWSCNESKTANIKSPVGRRGRVISYLERGKTSRAQRQAGRVRTPADRLSPPSGTGSSACFSSARG